MAAVFTVLVVGAGVFGTTAALELRRRGHRVTLVDPGPLPRPEAASTDLSKAVRMDYGSDDLLIDLGADAIAGWLRWNETWKEPPYHESGVLFLSTEPLRPGGFEHESFARLEQRGVGVVRVDSGYLRERHPALVASEYPDGYFNPRAGWVPSTAVMVELLAQARARGVVVRERVPVVALVEKGTRVVGARDAAGGVMQADVVVVACGAWTPKLVPETAAMLAIVGQPVFVLRPDDPGAFRPPHLPLWAADLSRRGWFGFPALPDGTVKIAHHGAGRPIDAEAPRALAAGDEARLRSFLAGSLPTLVDAPLVATRLCLYTDSWDGMFYVDHVPGRPGLVVATGGSGHAFKFAPVLGAIAADVVERRRNRYAERFRWRVPGEPRREHARSVQ